MFAREGEKKVAREVELFVSTEGVIEDEYTRYVCIYTSLHRPSRGLSLGSKYVGTFTTMTLVMLPGYMCLSFFYWFARVLPYNPFFQGLITYGSCRKWVHPTWIH